VIEVIGNAVRRELPEPDGKIGLRMEQDPGALRVAVTDGGPELKLDRGGMFSTM